MVTLSDLPEELLLLLASRYLPGSTAVSLSHCCSRLLNVLGQDGLWRGRMEAEGVRRESSVHRHAKAVAADSGWACVEKVRASICVYQ